MRGAPRELTRTRTHVRRARWDDTSTPRGSDLFIPGRLGPWSSGPFFSYATHTSSTVGPRGAVGPWAHPPSTSHPSASKATFTPPQPRRPGSSQCPITPPRVSRLPRIALALKFWASTRSAVVDGIFMSRSRPITKITIMDIFSISIVQDGDTELVVVVLGPYR